MYTVFKVSRDILGRKDNVISGRNTIFRRTREGKKMVFILKVKKQDNRWESQVRDKLT